MSERLLKLAKALFIVRLEQSFDARDVFVFGGALMLVRGVAEVYAPAGWVVAGLLFIWLGIRRA